MPIWGQERLKFSIANFELDPFDQTATNKEYEKIDGSGARYSIIKVTSDNPDADLRAFNFNFGNLRHEVKERDGELWVYVQKNAKIVTITREGYNPVNRHALPVTIGEGKVYVMQLSVAARPVYTQMVQFTIQPATATAGIMVKSTREGAVEELFGTTDDTGAAAKSLPLGTYTYRIVAENFYPSEGRFTLNDRTQTYKETVTLRPNGSEVTLRVNADADIYVNGEKKGHRTWTGILKAETHYVECRQEGHRNSTQNITVTEGQPKTFDLTSPTPITGTLAVTSRPLGATIQVDGKELGKTPQNINDLLIGKHNVILSRSGYLTENRTIEIKEKETTELEVALRKVAGDRETEKPTKKRTEGQREKASSLHFYLMAGAQVGSLMAANATAGINLGAFCAEASFLLPFATSEDIYWQNSSSYVRCNYKALAFGGKLGYAIPVMQNRLSLTPQVGATLVSVHSKDASSSGIVIDNGGSVSDGYALSGAVGLRADYAFTSHFGVYLAPELDFAVSKSDVFSRLSDVSSDIKSWANGFNLCFGLRFTF